MTEAQLRAAFTVAYNFIQAETRMRQVVFQHDPAKLERKLRDCKAALDAITAMKDFAKLHTEAPKGSPPEQVMLFDDMPRERGGY